MSIRKKLAALVAACMMLVALPALAFAAEYTPVGVNGTFTGTAHPALSVVDTFATADLATDAQGDSQNVELTYVGCEQIDSFVVSDANVQGITTPKVYPATGAVLSGATLTYNINWDALFNGVTFNAPGYYNFTIKAVGDNVNLVYAHANTLNVKVAVTKDATDPNKLAVYDIFITNEGQKVAGETAPINVPSNGGNNFVLSKAVKGIYADENQKFNFDVTITGAQGHYAVNFGNADASSTISPVDTGKINVATPAEQTFTVTLHHGQTLTINNLPVGATVKVNEQGTTGWVASYTSTDHPAVVTGVKDQALAADPVTIALSEVNVDFVNTKDGESSGILPTGLMMEVAPFILIALAATLGAVVLFAARRRRQSDEF